MASVLLTSIDYLPFIGGISLMTHHLANAMRHQGHNVHVVAPARSGMVLCDTQYALHADSHFDARHKAVKDKMRSCHKSRQLLRRLHAYHHFDGVFAMHPHYYGMVSYWMARQSKIPFAQIYHGTELRGALAQTGLSPHDKKRPLLLQSRNERCVRLAACADRVLVNSRYTADLLFPYGIEPIVSHCGINIEDKSKFLNQSIPSPANRRALRKSLGLQAKPCVGFIGRLAPSKNVAAILHAVATSQAFDAVIMGVGPDEERLKILAQRLGIAERIHFTGRVSDEDKAVWLKAVDVFCLPSKEVQSGSVEGFGIVLLEAWAAGTPVVVNRSGGMPYVVDTLNSGLVLNADDAEELAGGVTMLIKNSSLSKTMVQAGRKKIVLEYNWNAVAKTYLRALNIDDAQGDTKT